MPNQSSIRPGFCPSVLINRTLLTPFGLFINIHQLLVIIMITFNVIWHVFEEHQMMFKLQRAVVMLACALPSFNVNDGSFNLRSTQQAESQKRAMLTNILQICKWNKILPEVPLYTCMSTKSIFLKLSHHKR